MSNLNVGVFQNGTTPLNSTNLNKNGEAIKLIDDKVEELGIRLKNYKFSDKLTQAQYEEMKTNGTLDKDTIYLVEEVV